MSKRTRPRAFDLRDQFKASDFFARNPVFRLEEFVEAHVAAGRSAATSASLLRYHVAQGKLVNLRRGLYAAAPDAPDPWLLASKLAPDAVIAYDGALSFHGYTGLGYGMTVLSRERVNRFVYGEVVYRGVRWPIQEDGAGIIEAERSGKTVRVTCRERTLVDVLDCLELGPGPEGAWDCYVATKRLDVEVVAAYARGRISRLGQARVAFFLEQRGFGDHVAVYDLERHRPRSASYFDRKGREGDHTWFPRWGLFVSNKLLRYIEKHQKPRELEL